MPSGEGGKRPIFWRLTNGLTQAGGISRTFWPGFPISRPQKWAPPQASIATTQGGNRVERPASDSVSISCAALPATGRPRHAPETHSSLGRARQWEALTLRSAFVGIRRPTSAHRWCRRAVTSSMPCRSLLLSVRLVTRQKAPPEVAGLFGARLSGGYQKPALIFSNSANWRSRRAGSLGTCGRFGALIVPRPASTSWSAGMVAMPLPLAWP